MFSHMIPLAYLCVSLATAAEPVEPPNEPAVAKWNQASSILTIMYHGGIIFDGRVKSSAGAPVTFSETVVKRPGVEQRLVFRGKELALTGETRGSGESIAAETRGKSQETFPLIRTSHGPSFNLRNNAIYDRHWDWELALPADGSAKIIPTQTNVKDKSFSITCSSDSIELIFRPRFYQQHKGIKYYRPWSYQVRKDSIAGWCSWWAYMTAFNEQNLQQLLNVWKEKHLCDYGYRFIQIDDGYQSGNGMPKNWLKWNKKFPNGIEGYVKSIQTAGGEPGVWIYSSFNEEAVVKQHPQWFVRDAAGRPRKAPWLNYGMDSTIPEVERTLVRPTFRGFHQSGMSYVKIDALRHLLYDCLNSTPNYATSKGTTSADIFRHYLEVARDELGPDTFILACWGVLPEAVGLADGCRLGGDGFGPATLQQYNSWNGIVWRNDPDHCDVRPAWKPAEQGDVKNIAAAQSAPKDAILRPTLASVAGAMLMLSDPPEVYRDDANLEGVRRSAPVLFSVPGQLYDYYSRKTDALTTMDRSSIRSGAQPCPIDADQTGNVCPWWLNEIDRPFEHWNVLTRMNWSGNKLPAVHVRFADLGLDTAKEYLIYEFWTKKFIGVRKDSFDAPASEPKDTKTYAIREKLDRPQIVSTNRHISQGGVDLESVEWKNASLQGCSRVVVGDRYELAVYVPTGYSLESATIGGKPAEIASNGQLVRISATPTTTMTVAWKLAFSMTKN